MSLVTLFSFFSVRFDTHSVFGRTNGPSVIISQMSVPTYFLHRQCVGDRSSQVNCVKAFHLIITDGVAVSTVARVANCTTIKLTAIATRQFCILLFSFARLPLLSIGMAYRCSVSQATEKMNERIMLAKIVADWLNVATQRWNARWHEVKEKMAVRKMWLKSLEMQNEWTLEKWNENAV